MTPKPSVHSGWKTILPYIGCNQINHEIYKIAQVDSSYQFCKWINPHQQECDFGWNRGQWNITRQECHAAFSEKVGFVIIIILIKIIATVIIAIGNMTTYDS